MTGETRPDGMSAPVHLRLAGMALALGLAGCASVSGTNGGDAAGTSAAAGKEAASSAASASAATSAATDAATDAATSAAGDALKAAGVPTDLEYINRALAFIDRTTTHYLIGFKLKADCVPTKIC